MLCTYGRRVYSHATHPGYPLRSALAPHFDPCPLCLHCRYGQTELAGPVLFGNPSGDPNALLPLRGVRYELVRGESDAEDEGELVLLGNGSSTAGYLPNPSDPRRHRSLTGDAKGDERRSTSERYRTNDRFRREHVDGREMLLYICRADDLLVHTSGEMTNPLPSEQRLIAECPDLLHAVAVVGTNHPRCAALLELREGVEPNDAAVLAALRAGLVAANTAQPVYSHVLERHALLLPQGSMPLTVKGTVMRNKVHGSALRQRPAAQRRNPAVPQCRSAAVPQCRSAAVPQCLSASVPNARWPPCDAGGSRTNRGTPYALRWRATQLADAQHR